MDTQKSNGFTIIEVMLFLAVVGALAVGVLVGSGVAIGQQRYRDSVSTLKGFIQQQYNQTTNTANSRSGAEACTNAVIVVPPNPVPTPQPRGTTNCLLLGRGLSLSPDGTQITAVSVVAYRRSDTAPVEATDRLELTTNYSLATSPLDSETQTVAWGARIVKPKTTTSKTLSMMIIQSPLSGSILTFVSETYLPNLNALAALGPNTAPTDLCVEPSGGSFTGKQLAIRINAYATNASAIELIPESQGVCG